MSEQTKREEGGRRPISQDGRSPQVLSSDRVREAGSERERRVNSGKRRLDRRRRHRLVIVPGN